MGSDPRPSRKNRRGTLMADVNPDYLLEQFQLIEEYLRRAQGIASRRREEYLNDPYAVDASIRELIVLFETSHNIAKHLISREGWRAPQAKRRRSRSLASSRSSLKTWSTLSGRLPDSATLSRTRRPLFGMTWFIRSCKLT